MTSLHRDNTVEEQVDSLAFAIRRVLRLATRRVDPDRGN